VCHGPRVVLGGSGREESRGILSTKRGLKTSESGWRRALDGEPAGRDGGRHRASPGVGVSAIDSMTAEIHRQKWPPSASSCASRRPRRHRPDRAETGTRRARRATGRGGDRGPRPPAADARASVLRLAEDQRSVDERLAAAQRRLFEAREDARVRSDRVRDAMTEHARLLERAASLALDAAGRKKPGARSRRASRPRGRTGQISAGRRGSNRPWPTPAGARRGS